LSRDDIVSNHRRRVERCRERCNEVREGVPRRKIDRASGSTVNDEMTECFRSDLDFQLLTLPYSRTVDLSLALRRQRRPIDHAMSEPGPSYTVLRIKRKATEHPLSSLGSLFLSPRPAPLSPLAAGLSSCDLEPFAELCPDHPLTPVIQDEPARAKKQRQINPLGKSRGVFRLAETVPETWKGKGEEGEVLRVSTQLNSCDWSW